MISNHLDNPKLAEALEFIKTRPTTGSLAANDGLDSAELYRFMQIFRHDIDDTITGSELLPGEMLTPRKDKVSLPDDIYDLLVQYYNIAYDLEFVTITEAASSRLMSNFIVILPKVNQFGRIRIGAEVFGSTIAPRYIKNSYILAKFIA